MVNQSETPPYRTLTSEPLYGGVTVLADSSEPGIRRAAEGTAAGGEAVSSEGNQAVVAPLRSLQSALSNRYTIEAPRCAPDAGGGPRLSFRVMRHFGPMLRFSALRPP